MAKQGFDFGRTISGAVWMLRRDIGVLGPIVLIWAVIDFALYAADYALGLSAFSSIVTLSMFSVPLMAGAVTVMALSGGSMGTGETVQAAAARYWPLLVCYILSFFGTLVGFVLLVIPGLILMVMWAVAFPILLNEDVSPRRALGESYRRIRESFAPVAGLIALFIGLSVGVGILLGAVVPAAYDGAVGLALGLETITTVVLGTVGAYLNVAIYSELNHVSGPDVTVFD
jgi:hypothetical protein